MAAAARDWRRPRSSRRPMALAQGRSGRCGWRRTARNPAGATSSDLPHSFRIIHTAALLARTCQEQPPQAVRVNAVGSVNVLEAARQLGLVRVVMASSIAVYGHLTSRIVDEDHPCNPTTIYGAAKVLAENCGRAYRDDHGIEFVALRYGATYGPGPAKPPSRGVATDLRAFFEGAVRSREVVLSEQDNLGRPLVYVKDAARATALACCQEKPDRIVTIPPLYQCILNTCIDRVTLKCTYW